MIVKTMVGVAKKGVVDMFTLFVAVATFAVMLLGFPAAIVSVASILVGITYKTLKEGGKRV